MNRMGGRPRSTAVDEAVLRTTISLLGERGYAGLRINDIAEGSKTAKTTIYRRWPTMNHLVVAAMEHALGERAFTATGSIEADLDALVEAALGAFTGEGSALLAVALDIHRQDDPELRTAYRQRIIDPIRTQAIALVREAQDAGGFAAGLHPETAVDAVIGGIVYRGAILAEPVSVMQAQRFWREIIRSAG